MEKLAIEGGKPVITKSFPSGPIIGDEEIEAVMEVLKAKRLRRDEVTAKYEEALAKYFGVKHALAVANGTVSLCIALAAVGAGPGDEVMTTPYTMQATVGAILEQNAIPIFADIDPDYLVIDPNEVRKNVTDKTKVIIPVHILGHPADMDAIMEIAKEHNLWVIEDAAQAHGALYKGRKVGTIAHIASFSTVEGKMFTTGEGGFILTNDDELYEKMWSFHNFARNPKSPPYWQYHYGIPCTNYRITEIQSAIGLAQLKKLDKWNEKRRKDAEYLNARIKEIEGLEPPKEAPWARRLVWWYYVHLDLEKLGVTLREFARALAAEGVPGVDRVDDRQPLPCHLQEMLVKKVGYGETKCPFECPWYGRHIEYKRGQFPVAERACEEILWIINMHPLLTKEDLDLITMALEKVAKAYIEKQRTK